MTELGARFALELKNTYSVEYWVDPLFNLLLFHTGIIIMTDLASGPDEIKGAIFTLPLAAPKVRHSM